MRPPTSSASSAAGIARSSDGQLLVDLDAQRLEDPLGRVAGAAQRGRRRGVDQRDELRRRGQRRGCATLDDPSGVARRELLLAVLVEDAAQLRLVVLGEHAGGGQRRRCRPSACRAGRPSNRRSPARRGRAASTRRRDRRARPLFPECRALPAPPRCGRRRNGRAGCGPRTARGARPRGRARRWSRSRPT